MVASGFEGFVAAKAFAERPRRAGRDLTRERFIAAVEAIGNVDLGGFVVNLTPTNRNGSRFVDLHITGRDGKLVRQFASRAVSPRDFPPGRARLASAVRRAAEIVPRASDGRDAWSARSSTDLLGGDTRMRDRILAALLAATLATPTVALAQSHGAIVIGQSAPLSGSNKELGQDIRDGALAFFKKVNDAGGIHGRKIELVTLDDVNDTKRAEENTKVLLDTHKVVALFGYASATLSRPALPLVEQAGVPFFAPFTGAEPMRKFNRFVYNHRASYADELEKIVEHYSTFGMKRFAVLHYDDAIGKENFAAVDRALKSRGLTPVAIAAIPRKDVDVAAAVALVTKATPDVVITTTLYQATADFIKLARKQGLGAQFVSTSFAGSTPLAQALGTDGLGVAMAQVVPTVTRASIPIVKEYQQAAEKLLGKRDYSFTSLEGYIAAKVLVEGIRRAGPQVSRESLLKALDSIQGFDVGGYVVSFSPTNHNGSSFVGLTILARDLAFRD